MFATPASAPISAPIRPPAARLANILDTLCRAIADRGGRKLLAGPLVILIWSRLRRLSTRVLALAARIEAGTNKPARPRRKRAAPRAKRPPPPLRLPRGKAWLIRLARMESAAAASQLRTLLAQPDMQALAAADPRMGRLLRPLCHILGVTPTPEIAKPASRPKPAPSVAEPAPPDPAPEPAAAESAPPQAATSPPSSHPRRRAPRGTRRALPSHGPPSPLPAGIAGT